MLLCCKAVCCCLSLPSEHARCHAAEHDGGSAAEADKDTDDEGSRVTYSDISSCLIGPGEPRVLSKSLST